MKGRTKIALTIVLGLVLCSTHVFGAAKYSDIAGHKDSKYILEYAQRGFVDGYPDGTFQPDKPITRAEVTALLDKFDFYAVTFDNFQLFLDVKKEDWYYNFVYNAAQAGVIRGYEGNVFQPQNTITRFEAISMLSSFVRSDDYDTVQLPYADADKIPLWVYNAVKNLYAAGIIQEYDNNEIHGTEPVTRSEIVRMLAKLLEQYQWDKTQITTAALNNAKDPLPTATEIPYDLLGYITIDSINMKEYPVKDGADLTTIKTAIGHFAQSSTWDGNVALCGHNRDYQYDFRYLHKVEMGDVVVYKTRFGERQYVITEKRKLQKQTGHL